MLKWIRSLFTKPPPASEQELLDAVLDSLTNRPEEWTFTGSGVARHRRSKVDVYDTGGIWSPYSARISGGPAIIARLQELDRKWRKLEEDKGRARAVAALKPKESR